MLGAEAVCLGVCDVVRGDFELASKNHQVGKIDKRGVAHFKSPFNESQSPDVTDCSPEALGTISNLNNRVAQNPTAFFNDCPKPSAPGEALSGSRSACCVAPGSSRQRPDYRLSLCARLPTPMPIM